MNQIIASVSLIETKVALLEGQELVELYIDRKNSRRIVGNIYKGRVINVLPGMEAAFVDIGLEKNAFLYVKDALSEEMFNQDVTKLKDLNIRELVKPGQEIVVQVIKEPISSKGARVTRNITLPGRYLVLMPYTDYVGVSRQIGNTAERDRLKSEIEEIKPANMGIIVRTVAAGKEKEDFKDDIKFLLKLWLKIEKDKKLGYPPKTIYKDFDILNRTIRDTFTKSIERFVIDSPEAYQQSLELVELISPHLKDKLKLYEEPIDIFEYYGIESQIQKALEKKIWLQSGGYIIIDLTEALTVIDVNTGKYVGSIDLEDTVFKTNMEATKEIAKQLRLRNIGGIIIMDFIDMTNPNQKQKVLELLEKELSKDRTRTKVLGMTQLGLVEMTRKKVRDRIESTLQTKCPTCEGTGRILCEQTMLTKLEKMMIRTQKHTNAAAAIVDVNPNTYEAMMVYRTVIEEIELQTNIKVYFNKSSALSFDDLKVRSIGSIEMIQKLVDQKYS
ncbi:ribonuclease, Rne/Rng family [Alkaliphilus metalliredigens QYMF]|uniref:Ribonuclease, Rne/Rng family n=1 Tax=Alkaliphilus metalliredigens (strain QYMF) TaxID=293826 RepID=A6TQJ1_ALKMQ|nr:Rne/Rng family ribonuclease [Alkaliphilus metalliredigens]ABR48459.1 ribonuclease, Rne/Rng family [Alkaliphilus metalliredigens QYMF]